MLILECPYCEYQPVDAEWLYNNDLYIEQNGKTIECPACENIFYVDVSMVPDYEVSKEKEE